ncbi:MAG: DUF6569 family protein [Reyranellaceae bacterium]
MKILPLAAMACALALAAPMPSLADTPAAHRLGPPATHENLTIFLVRGERPAGKAVPVTLQEAMQKGLIRVRETGDVNSLEIENLGAKDVFVQAGDIVKGGKQDRVLSVDLVLGPKSGPTRIASFCVEQGRWQKRGNERVESFSGSTASLPSREMKLAAKQAASPRGTADLQQKVWNGVRDVQRKLDGNLGAPAAAAASPSSLQLTMENEKLKTAVGGYEQVLRGMIEAAPDAVGFVVAINGKPSSADLYSSPELFRAMWPKLLHASAVEAVAEKNGAAFAPATADQALAFLDQARQAPAARQKITARVAMETRETDKVLASETQLAEGGWVHRSYVAK